MSRLGAALLCVLIFAGGVGYGALATHSVMQNKVEKATVNSFNDGFLDGACKNGEDGLGNKCGGK